MLDKFNISGIQNQGVLSHVFQTLKQSKSKLQKLCIEIRTECYFYAIIQKAYDEKIFTIGKSEEFDAENI